jgi:hypothetical protein
VQQTWVWPAMGWKHYRSFIEQRAGQMVEQQELTRAL